VALQIDARDAVPAWYRGPEDPSGYRVQVCTDLRLMRGPTRASLTMADMAAALSEELHRHVPESSVLRWESGKKVPGADVYAAYVTVSGSPRVTDVRGQDVRLARSSQLGEMQRRIKRLEAQAGQGFEDPISVSEAMRLLGCVRQTVHNMVGRGELRAVRQGTMVRVSRADVVARIPQPDGQSANRD
jgi:excisionase family DNA binding protein